MAEGLTPEEERIARALRTLGDEDAHLDAPPADLWDRIAAAAAGPDAGADFDADIDADVADEGRAGLDDGPVGHPADELAARRRVRPRWLPAAVAAAVALIAGVAVAAGIGLLGDDGEGAGEVLARAELSDADLPVASGVTGTADLRREGERLVLDLALPDLPGAGEGTFYEVWLLAADATRLQPLGVTDGAGRYQVPAGIDPRQYPLVDVSREPLDGDPAHSGDSVVRGALEPDARRV